MPPTTDTSVIGEINLSPFNNFHTLETKCVAIVRATAVTGKTATSLLKSTQRRMDSHASCHVISLAHTRLLDSATCIYPLR